jgi:eukaryotic-like serine/threonine-protein kinase
MSPESYHRPAFLKLRTTVFQPHIYGRYLLLDRISVGGMAEIFVARPLDGGSSREPIVLKRVLPHLAVEPSFVKMFSNEAAFCVRLHHPHIIRTYDSGTAEDNHYLTMEYVAGQDLLSISQLVRRTGDRLPLELAAYICKKVAEGLQHAHALTGDEGDSLGLVHRDVTPENILVGYDGSVKLLDFGIARAKGHTSETRSGVLKGKVGYIAPEQAIGDKVDHRADIFSLGIVALELFTSQRLFAGLNEFVVLERLRTEAIPAPSSLSAEITPELDELVVWATQRKVEDRLPDAATFASHLSQLYPDHDELDLREQLKRWVRGSFAAQVATAERRAEDYLTYDVLPDGQVVQEAPPIEDATSQWDLPPDDSEAPNTVAMRRFKPTEVSILGGRLDGTPPPHLGDLSQDEEPETLAGQQTPGRNLLDLPTVPKKAVEHVAPQSMRDSTPTPATTIDLSHPFGATPSRNGPSIPDAGPPGATPRIVAMALTIAGLIFGLGCAHLLLPPSNNTVAGALVIKVNPASGIAVHLDGKLIAERAPIVIQGIQRGQHRLSVERHGYRKYLHSFVFDAGQEMLLDVALVPIAPPTAKFKIRLNPPLKRAQLTVQGRPAQLNAMITVQADTATIIEVNSDGHAAIQREMKFRPGEAREIVLNPEPLEGTLIVETRPPGTAFLNGRRHGRTPTTIRGLDVNRTYSLVVQGQKGMVLKKSIRFGAQRLLTVDERLKKGRR